MKEFNLLLFEHTVALRCRCFASGLASEASEYCSADQRETMWA